jgi:hypothetical protein
LFKINGIFFAQPISDLISTILSIYLIIKEKNRLNTLL